MAAPSLTGRSCAHDAAAAGERADQDAVAAGRESCRARARWRRRDYDPRRGDTPSRASARRTGCLRRAARWPSGGTPGRRRVLEECARTRARRPPRARGACADDLRAASISARSLFLINPTSCHSDHSCRLERHRSTHDRIPARRGPRRCAARASAEQSARSPECPTA